MVCEPGADEMGNDMHIFDFCKKEWSALKLAGTPPPVGRPFISAYGSSLLQFGGALRPLACMLLSRITYNDTYTTAAEQMQILQEHGIQQC